MPSPPLPLPLPSLPLPLPSPPLSPSPTQTVDMLSAFKAKLRAAREESRGCADSVADAEDLGSGGGAEVEEEEGSGWYVCYVGWCNLLQWNLFIQDTLNRGTSLMRTLSAVPTTQSCAQVYF